MKLEMGVCGLFQLETFKCDTEGVEIDGSRKIVAPWFRNLITDAGLNRMGSSAGWKTHCQVGSGTAPPSVTDSQLSSRIAGTSDSQGHTVGASTSAPWYGRSRSVRRFAAGVAAGNISEVGMGWATSGSLFSRALILDSSGNPTSITVLPDEFLDVTYEFRQYAPTEDVTGVINLSGVDYSYTVRAAEVTGSQWQQTDSGAQLQMYVNLAPQVFTGDIGVVTGGPSGSVAQISASNYAYSAGSLLRRAVISASPTEGNLSGGIRSMSPNTGTSGKWQVQFDPKVPKNSGNTLSLTCSFSWARKIL